METKTHSHWICHTCKTFCVCGNPPYLQDQLNDKPPAADQVETLIKYLTDFFDPFWFNTRDIWVSTLRKFVMWRRKHRNHDLNIFKHATNIPSGYTEEKL